MLLGLAWKFVIFISYILNFCLFCRNQDRNDRMEFYDIVDELLDIGKSVPESKHTEVTPSHFYLVHTILSIFPFNTNFVYYVS